MTTPHSWRKSTRSTNTDNCVEVGQLSDGAAVRDTKNRTGAHLTTTRAQWTAFITAVKTDRFN